MRRFRPSNPDALFSGKLHPDDAPPELREIAGLIQAARAPGSADELVGEELLVSAMAAEVRRSSPFGAPASAPRRRLVGQVLSGKVIAVTAAVLLSGGVAAAATDSLPASIQKAVSHGLAHVGISVPAPASGRPPTRSTGAAQSSSTQSKGHGVVTSPTEADRFGLCTAYLHPNKTSANSSGTKLSTTAFSRLAAAAQAKGETVAEYCQSVTPPSTTIGTNSSSSHRPTTSTVPRGIGRSRGKPGANTHPSTHRHLPKTIPIEPGPASSTPANKVPVSRSAKGSSSHSATHPNQPSKVHASTSAINATTSTTTTTSVTTTTLAQSLPGNGAAESSAGKGISPDHTH